MHSTTNKATKMSSFSGKKPSALFFYKGTAFPTLIHTANPVKDMRERANEMIILGMKHGITLDEQKKDYFEQLDLIEETLCETSNKGRIDEKTIKRACKLLGEDTDSVYITWCLNICALLKLKAIKDDEMNGIVSFS